MEQKKCWWKALLKAKTDQDTVSHVMNINIEAATKKGDNYMGELKRITLELLLKSGKISKKSIIIKSSPTSTLRKDLHEKLGISRREIMVYRDILPYMEDIMREYNDYSEFMWGSCLHYNPYNTLYLVDLTKEGYMMKDRKLGLDMEHCLLVFRSLAKFHATSLILKKRNLISMEIFRENLVQHELFQQLNEPFLKDAYKRLADLVDTWEPEWKPIAEQIRTKISPNIIKMLENLFKTDESKFNVLCHGDCWVNNMMFKNGLDGVTPISVKFLDFQLTFYNSPAFDLHYFLSSSANLEVRRKNIPKLLEVYHETLCKQLECYKYEGKIISLDELNIEMKRLDLFSLNIATTLLPAMFIENTEEVPDMEEYLKKVIETKEVDKDSWKEYFNPSSRFGDFMKVTLERIVKNNSLFA
ncbi:hypothetical protein O3M35_001074 [Rhynocoris fuscipes]|uniref:CHK kinase-like domain-containing protein n=1 Tax=Rhynocoris fuscipes TaxID=488301 RepID=A0AAW1DTW1_9HEMI